jgi:AraC-like DNA-binding protein
MQSPTEMAVLVDRLAPQEGYTESAIPGVRFMRANGPVMRAPVLYEPSICIVVQGRKHGFLGGRVYVYDAQHYLVLSVPMSFESETEASAKRPLLGMALRIEPGQAAEIALVVAQDRGAAEAQPCTMASTPVDGELSDALLRLLRVLASPLEARIRGPGILREIYFRVLTGEQGAAMRAALAQGSRFQRIARALYRMHDNYADALDVATLAHTAGMSAPAFYANFKATMGTSPLQYLKAMRLHQARLLMVRQGVTAASACVAVGYESASQFSREFRRLFGRTPVEEAQRMKSVLALRPSAQVR